MSLIEKRLSEALDHEILVVQTDGKAFKGRLVEADKDFVLLHDCLETSTREVKWKSVMVPLPSATDGRKSTTGPEEGSIGYGEKEKKVAILRKVMINLAQVQRIWLWDPEEFKPKEFEDIGLISF